MTEITVLMKRIGYEFKNKSLINVALTHSSFSRHTISKNNERLEFLGDRVLGLIISEEIFKKYHRSSEGDLAKKLSFLVCRSTLKKIANKIQLDDFILHSKNIKKSSLETIKANSLEALIAAIYLDSNITITSRVIKKLWKEFIENINLQTFDPKSRLQEWSLKNKKKLPIYKVISKSGPDHDPLFTIKVLIDEDISSFAEGKSKQDAEINAANKLLKEICE